jgi:hypothetical protein
VPTRVPRTEPRGALPSSSFKYNPLQHVRYLYTIFVQGLFYRAPRGAYHWEEELQDSEIVITAEAPLNTTTLGDRPGITFTRAPIAFRHLGFDDMLKVDAASGQKMKGLLIPGTMIVNCCSKNDLESEQIAWVTAEGIWLLRDQLMQQGFYDIGRNIQISAPSKAGGVVEGDGAQEFYCTSITSPFQFQRTSVFTPLGQRLLQGLTLQMGLNPQASLQQGIPIPGGTGPVDPPFEQDVYPPPPFAPGAGNPNIRSLGNPSGLPLVPHPLDPSKLVIVRPVRADQPGVRPPSINGQVLPILAPPVTSSEPETVLTTTVKV